MNREFTYYEFFSGGGMARLGLGDDWHCIFANDWSEKKALSYRANFGASPELVVSDIHGINSAMLPGQPTLLWASFPCQDLSLAGYGKGINGKKSGAFWALWNLIEQLQKEKRKPPIIVLENVTGAITSNGGKDFGAILWAIAKAGYAVGPMVVDAVKFVPQSRPRLFIVAIGSEFSAHISHLTLKKPSEEWHPDSLRRAYSKLPKQLRRNWLWLHIPKPSASVSTLSDIIQDEPNNVVWHSPKATKKILSLMSPLHRNKVAEACASGKRIVGTIYKRSRRDQAGLSSQRAEVRFDQISGCLRTPSGGSSRQLIMIVAGSSIRSRLLAPREAARLMGVSDDYVLPERYNDAYQLMGDGLVVPVVSWIEKHLIRQIAQVVCREEKAVA